MTITTFLVIALMAVALVVVAFQVATKDYNVIIERE